MDLVYMFCSTSANANMEALLVCKNSILLRITSTLYQQSSGTLQEAGIYSLCTPPVEIKRQTLHGAADGEARRLVEECQKRHRRKVQVAGRMRKLPDSPCPRVRWPL